MDHRKAASNSVKVRWFSRRRRLALRKLMLTAMCAASMLITGTPLTAATWTWNNTSGNWSDTAPWGGTAPTGTDSTDILQFGSDLVPPFVATNDIAGGGLGGAFQLNILELAGTNFALRGTALQFDDPGSEIRNIDGPGTAVWRIDNNIILNTDVTVGGTGTGTIAFAGSLSGAGRLVVSKPSGVGTIILNGSNANEGVTLAGGVNTSILAIGNKNALGTGTFNIGGGTVRANAPVGAISNAVSITGNFTAGQTAFHPGLNFSGPVDLGGATRTITDTVSDLEFSGTVSNGGITKAGTGGMILSGINDYEGGTAVTAGTLTVRQGSNLGGDVLTNDVTVSRNATLRLADPSALGFNQVLTLDTASATNSAPILALGAGFNGGATVGFANSGTGIGNIHLTNIATNNRLAIVALDGANDFQTDFMASASALTLNTRVYLGATTTNGTFTGSTLSTGRDGSYNLGGGGGTLTIANTNVLTGAHNVVVGSYDGTSRGIVGTVFIRDAQNYTGTTGIGNAGTLIAANAGVFGSTPEVRMQAGSLQLMSDGFSQDDTQYSFLNLNYVNSSTLVVNSLNDGGSGNNIHLGAMTLNGNVRATFTASSNTLYNTIIDGPTFVTGSGTNFFYTVTNAKVTVAGSISQTSGGVDRNLDMTGSGVLELANSNGYRGTTGQTVVTNTNKPAGIIMVTHTSGIGLGTLLLNGNNSAVTGLDLRNNGSGSDSLIVFRASNIIASGSTTNNNYFINVSRVDGTHTGNTITFESAPGVATDLTIGSDTGPFNLKVGELSTYYGGPLLPSDILAGVTVSGADYRLRFGGTTTLTGNVIINATSGQLEFTGVVTDDGTPRDLTKIGRGTLVLSGTNTYSGDTTINGGHVVIENDQAFGLASSAIVMGLNQTESLLLKGEVTLNRDINVTATAGVQTIGGFGGSNPKFFTGNLSLNRTIQATSLVGGDVTFSGVISGVGGVTKVEDGTINLTNSNAFTGDLTVNAGKVAGFASTAGGSPFGDNNNITLNGGILELNGDPTGNVNVATTGNLTAAGRGRLQINDAALSDGFVTQMTVNNFVRTGNGTLRVVPGQGSLNVEEIVTITGTSDVTNGIVAPWAVAAASGVNDAADYMAFSGSNLVVATYDGSGDINTVGGSTSVWNVNAAGTMGADNSVFAMKTDVATDLGGNTLELGDPTVGLGGIIMNNGASISNGRVRLGDVEALIYVESGQTSTISANITGRGTGGGLNKFGVGTLVLANTNSYRGTTDVNNGTLLLATTNALFRGFSLAALVGSTVNIEAGATLDLGNNDQEFGSLSGDGILNIGTATLRTGTSSGSQTFNGQIIGGAGSTLIKTGANTLVLNNTDGRTPTSIENIVVERGTLQVNAQGSTSGFATPQTAAVPGTTEFTLKGGQLFLYHNGDFSSAPQNLLFGNDITVAGAPSGLRVDRYVSGASGNTILLGSLTIGDGLQLTTSSGNTYNIMFTGTTTLLGDATLQITGGQVALMGEVTDNGAGATLSKLGVTNPATGTFIVGSANSYSGGTVLSGGTTMFGVLFGNSVVYNETANLGTGHVVLQPGTAIRYNAATNVADGSNLYAYSADGQNVRIEMQFDGPISDVHLRSRGTGSIAFNVPFIETAYDQGLIGDGTWTMGAYLSSVYNADTLGAGANSTYRFGGSQTSSQVLSINKANVLTGANGVQVGDSRSVMGAQSQSTLGILQLNDDQDYTGDTVVYRNTLTNFIAPGAVTGNTLDFRGTLATGNIDVYGDLRATGRGTFTDADGQQVNNVILHVGSTLRLDYNAAITGALLPNQSGNSETNKWQDDLGINLRGASLTINSASGQSTTERIGGVTIEDGADISVLRVGTNGQSILEIDGALTRVGQASLTFHTASANELGDIVGSGARVRFVDFDNAPTRGVVGATTVNQVAAWIINSTDDRFVDYTPVLGFIDAPFTVTSTTATFDSGANDGTDIVNTATAAAINVSSTADVYSLRTAVNNTIISGNGLIVRSGGLINASTNLTVASDLYFGDGTTPVEGVIYGDIATGGTTTLSGLVTAANLTKAGRNALVLSGSNNITGNIQVNNGKLMLIDGDATGGASVTLAGAPTTAAGAPAVELALRASSTNQDFNTDVIVAEDIGLVTISVDRAGATGSNGKLGINSLTVNASDDIPTVINVTASPTLGSTTNHGYDLNINGDLNLLGGGETIFTTLPGSAVATITVFGDVTGNSRLVMSSTDTMQLRSTNATFTGGMTVNQGTLLLGTGTSNGGGAGTGSLIVNGGTLRTFTNSSASLAFFNNDGNNLTVNGSATLQWDHLGSAAATSQWGTANTTLTLNGDKYPTITISGTTGVVAQWNGDVVVEGNVTLNLTTSAQWQGVLSGSGLLAKTGNSRLTFVHTPANTFVGQLWINQGTVRQATNSATPRFAGAGSEIFVNPGAGITSARVESFRDGAAGPSQITRFYSTSTAPALLGIGFNTTQAIINSTAVLDVNNILSDPFNTSGVLGVDSTNTTALDMATLFNGHWYLGSSIGGTYNVATLGAGIDGIYRLGGGGGTLTIAQGALSGANSVIVGQASGWNMNSQVSLSGTNTYSGGTTVTRARDANGNNANATLSVQGGGLNRQVLGTGAVDVYGTLRIETAAGTAVFGAAASDVNGNTYTFHPGAVLVFDNNTPSTHAAGRWGDTDGIDLNGSTIQMLGDTLVAATNSETVGDITFDRGSEISVVRRSPQFGELIALSLTRTNNGTLTLAHDSGLLGVAGATNADRLIIAGGVSMTNSMVAPYIVSRSQSQFLQYDDTLGFQLVDTNAPNYVINSIATLDAPPLNDGTEILDVATVAPTLTANLDVWALRTSLNINNSADLQFNTITIRSGGLTTYSSSTRRIDPNLLFIDGSDNPIDAFIHASSGTLQLNGIITANNIYKFGTSVLEILADQTAFNNTWYVNQGVLSVRSPEALGSGDVVLNGGSGNGPELRFALDTGTPDNVTFSSGTITAFDNNTIRAIPGVNDRNYTIGDIDLKATGTGSTPAIRFALDSSRVNLTTGNVTVFDDYIINTVATSFPAGASNTVLFGGLIGTDKNITKIGDGRWALGDISSTFIGGSITVDQGSLDVRSNGSLGSESTHVIIDQGGILQISTANFLPTATNVEQRPGSIERWSVDGARTVANLGPQVSLQVDANQTGTQTISLNGGSIAGYLNTDSVETLVFRTLGANVSINLLSDSFLGIIQPLNTPLYGIGQVTQESFLFSNLPEQGARLEIKGNIAGDFDLTKVGPDTVELSGTNNTYNNTIVTAGLLRIGADNSLPTSKTLITTIGGTFDMNGYDQTVGNIAGAAGLIYNSSAGILKNLTIDSTNASTYAGAISGNIVLIKQGVGELALTSSNDYRGDTHFNGGTLTVGADDALGDVTRSNLIFDGGTLRTFATFGLDARRSLTLNAGGGTFDTDLGTTLTLNQGVHGIGSLTKTGGGTLVLDPPDNDYAGDTTINDGILLITTPDGLPTGTLLTINTGANNGGRFDMNGFDQTVANIAGNGGNVYNDDANPLVTLTVTGLTDSAYAGAIGVTGGSGIFLTKNGPGKLTLSGNSSYIGNTFLNGGTLSVNQDTNLGASPSIIFGDAAAVLQITGLDNSTFNHTIDVGTTAGNVDVTEAANNASFTGLVGGNTLTKTGPGQLTFLGANAAFTGPAIVDGGTLATDNSSGLGLAPVTTLNNDGTLKIINNGSANSWTGPITVNGPNAGFDIASGDVTYTGALLINGGAGVNIQTNGQTLFIAAGATIAGSGDLGIEGGSTVMVNNGTNALTGDVNVFGTLGGNADFSNAGVVTVGAGGTITPGNSIGEMLVNNLTLDGASLNNAVWVVEVNEALSTEYTELDNHLADIIHVTGLIDLSGDNDELHILGLDSVTFGTYPFIIASYGSLIGTFDFLSGIIPDTYYVDYHYQGQNLIAIVPEPTTLSLLGLGLGLTLLRRRRRDRA